MFEFKVVGKGGKESIAGPVLTPLGWIGLVGLVLLEGVFSVFNFPGIAVWFMLLENVFIIWFVIKPSHFVVFETDDKDDKDDNLASDLELFGAVGAKALIGKKFADMSTHGKYLAVMLSNAKLLSIHPSGHMKLTLKAIRLNNALDKLK